MPSQLSHDDYTVGWICALPLELAAAQAVLDEAHKPLPARDGDSNIYAYGRISEHNVVIACLPAGLIGTNSAASVAMQMQRSFSCLRFGLMVGIGGGVPSKEQDIRLGDVVVAQPGNGFGGVVQYDFGKSRPDGFERTGFLNGPPTALLSAVSMLRATQEVVGGASGILDQESIATAARPPSDDDVLHSANTDDAAFRVIDRQPSSNPGIHVHYGTIASGNQVMRHASQRDKVSRELGGILCFEMEAAGLMNSFPCLVIRGISDYSDAHKTKNWQPFAAATAAVYTKQLLAVLPNGVALNEKTLAHDRLVSLPFQRNHKFVGRQDVLRELERRLFLDGECQDIALFGLGGIGKTQIVLQFASMVSETRPDMTIFWIVALSQATIEKSFLEIAGQLKLGLSSGSKADTKDVVKRHLEHSYSRRWLMVIDNVDDESLVDMLLRCVPHGRSGYKLYTSRNTRVIQDLAGGDAIEVPRLGEEEGLRLMTKALLKYNSGQHEPDIRALCEELEFLPLALTQAAAYMNQTLITPAKYRTLMTGADQDLIRLMSVENKDRTRYQQVGHAVATTWVVSFNQIRQNQPIAAEILQFISCVEWRSIPLSMLPAAGSAVEVTSAVGFLCAYSFLAPSAIEDTYDMHRLVHLATRLWANKCDIGRVTRTGALIHMEAVFPLFRWAGRDISRSFLPHAVSILRTCGQDEHRTQAKLCLRVGGSLMLDARYTEAIHWLETSRQLLTSFVSETVLLLHVESHLAQCYYSNFQESRGIQLLEEVVTRYRGRATDGEPHQFQCEVMLGIMNTSGDRIQDAVTILEQVVSTMKRTYMSDSFVLQSESQLGSAYLAQGDVEKAIRLLEHVSDLQRSLPERYLGLALTRMKLSDAYLAEGSLGRVKKAIQLLEGLDSFLLRVLGLTHHARLCLRVRLAEAYLLEGSATSTSAAVGLMEHVVQIRAAALPSDDLVRLDSEYTLAKAYLRAGQRKNVSKAVKMLERLVSIESKVQNCDNHSLLCSERELGRAYVKLNDPKAILSAVDLLQHIVRIRAQTLTLGDTELLLCQDILREALEARSRLQSGTTGDHERTSRKRGCSAVQDILHTSKRRSL